MLTEANEKYIYCKVKEKREYFAQDTACGYVGFKKWGKYGINDANIPRHVVCYENLKHFGGEYKCLALFFSPCKVPQAYEEHCMEYINWFINYSFFADIFLTKNVKQGLKKGFIIDPNHGANYVYSGMMIFRYHFEFQQWSAFAKARKLGFDVEESYVLSHCLVYLRQEKCFHIKITNNHHVFMSGMSYGTYFGDNYNPKKDKILFSNPERGSKLSPRLHFNTGTKIKVMQLKTKQALSTYIEQMKGC